MRLYRVRIKINVISFLGGAIWAPCVFAINVFAESPDQAKEKVQAMPDAQKFLSRRAAYMTADPV